MSYFPGNKVVKATDKSDDRTHMIPELPSLAPSLFFVFIEIFQARHLLCPATVAGYLFLDNLFILRFYPFYFFYINLPFLL